MAGKKLTIIIALLLAITLTANAESQFENFVTASGSKLMDGDTELRFISFNIPCLHYGEDNLPFEISNAWRLPDAFEINDALEAIRQIGGKVTRCYTLSVRKPGESDSVPRHVLAPGEFNEKVSDTFSADTLSESARQNLQNNILPFWLNHSIDTTNGGFHGRIATDGTPEQNAPKGLVLNARILWTFSAAYMYDSKPAYLKTARRAYEYLIEHFLDTDYGGAYWLLDNKGNPTDDSKELYGQSFAVYALAEYYRATGHYPAIEKAIALYETIEQKAHDTENKGHLETFSRDWTPAPKARLAYEQQHATKTMNTHLHLLEAYTNLYRVWQDPRLKASLEELIIVFRDHIIDHKTWHFKLFFDSQWNSTSQTISFGHDIEGSWLLTEAAELLGNQKLTEEIEEISIKMAQACYTEALDTDGGLFYEAEPDGISIRRKDWWPQAETVVGFLNAYQLTNQPRYLSAADKCWQFTMQNLVDTKYGEWFSKASPKRPADKDQKTSEWKAPYHNGRACLEIIKRTQTIKIKE